VQINAVAGETASALDLRAFWQAWVADAATADTFAPDWDFWAHVVCSAGLRQRDAIPRDGPDE
jgi:hypothetical protein